jgi:hypothetical protein
MLDRWRSSDEAFAHSKLAEAGWIRAAGLSQMWQHAKSSGSVGLQLWYLYVLELWFRAEVDYCKNLTSLADVARPSIGR